MRVATATIDVRPPRATRWKKLMRAATSQPTKQAYFGVQHSVVDYGARGASTLREVTGGTRNTLSEFWAARPPLLLLVRGLIPGWPQFSEGRRRIALAILASFLFCLISAVPMCRYSLARPMTEMSVGGVLLGIACSIHSSSATGPIARYQAGCRVGVRVAWSMLVSILFVVLIYVPVAWQIARYMHMPLWIWR
jgi:hypothetical protein